MNSRFESSPLRPVWWDESAQALGMIDQTKLPTETVHLACRSLNEVWTAIKTLQVRGAPAIGVAAAYGVIVSMDESLSMNSTLPANSRYHNWPAALEKVCDHLATSRPTAVNLFWALGRMREKANSLAGRTWPDARAVLLAEAHAIRNEDAAMCRSIGEAGQHLIAEGAGVLTHCNAGALATSEYGTALAVMYAAHERGRKFDVFVDETRPLLQGSRLTAWELRRAGIDATLICDNMAAVVMRERKIGLVITGADRIAANGDTANKIGTYGLAVLAHAHGIKFYVAAPSSTFDLSIPDGTRIPIEERAPDEVRTLRGQPTAPQDMRVFNPAFDITPARLITGIITEKGLISPVTAENVQAIMNRTERPTKAGAEMPPA